MCKWMVLLCLHVAPALQHYLVVQRLLAGLAQPLVPCAEAQKVLHSLLSLHHASIRLQGAAKVHLIQRAVQEAYWGRKLHYQLACCHSLRRSVHEAALQHHMLE